MQTLSNLQRNSSYKRALTKILTAIGLLYYESITSIYPYLPSLFGLFFIYLLFYLNSKLRFYEILYSFFYIIVYELDKGFYLFSFIIFFIIYYNFIKEEIKKYIFCKLCLAFVYVFSGYIGYYGINYAISFILNENMPSLIGFNNTLYFLNIAIDTVLVFFVFKNRL